MSVITQWLGEEDVMIYGHTNPWLQSTNGGDVDLQELISAGLVPELPRRDDDDCDTCLPGMLRGVFAPVDSPIGIQACDQCDLFPGDLHAARALAEYLAEVLELTVPYTVWFERAVPGGAG